MLQVIVQLACTKLSRGYFASFGRHTLLVQIVKFDAEVWDEDLRPMLQEFYELRSQEFIPNLLKSHEAAFLKQVLRDYRNAHVTAPKLYTHGLRVD